MKALARAVALATLLATSGGAPALGQEATPDPSLADVLPACVAPAAPGSAPPDSMAGAPDLVTGRPVGSEVTGLGAGVVGDLPPQRSQLVLTVRRIRLAPGVSTAQQPAFGPLLYRVVAGGVRFSVNGVGTDHAAGGTPFVQTGQYYRYENSLAEPLVLLRVALVPSDRETDVGYTGEPAETEMEAAQAAPADALTTDLLVRGGVTALPAAGLRLFLACLSWPERSADVGTYRQQGPLAVAVLRGRLSVDGGAELREGGCRLFLPSETHSLAAAEPPPVVLLAGALPEGRPLWAVAPPGSVPPAVPAGAGQGPQCAGN